MRTLFRLFAILAALLSLDLHAGNLRVNLSPSAAVSAGAQWRVDGGAWRNSGAAANGLSNTNHVVEFKTVVGWITPASMNVAITSGTKTVSVAYAQAASLRITLTPSTGQWRIDGGAWRSSGTTATGLTPGAHSIEYLAVDGYTAPATESVTLVAGQLTSLARSYLQLAQLTLTLTPARAQWSVNGGTWQNSGATIANLTPGNHTITYAALNGYIAPVGETVALASGQSLALVRNYTQAAEIWITLVPSAGQWRANGGAWQASGSRQFVAPGSYTIEYAPVSLYDPPATDTATLAAGGIFSATKHYTSQKPTLRIHLTPSNGQWRLDGGAWQASGAQLTELTAGSHTIDYTDIGGAYAPLASETVTLALRDQTTLARSYSLKPASLAVTLTPASGQWRVDGGAWQASGATVSNLAPGAHFVEFGPAFGYAIPAAQTLTLASGEQRSLAVSYTPVASVYVIFNPSWLEGQWRIDGGDWKSPGSTAYNLAVGVPHTVEYSTVVGYVTPPSETFTLAGGENRTLTGTYVGLASVYVYANPNWLSAQWRIDGGAWRDVGTTAYNLSFNTPHTIDFAAVDGYLAPVSQTVTLSAGESRSITANYTQLASLYVNLDLPGAKWRVDGGQWRNAGNSVYGLSLGTHSLEFSLHDGYLSPATETLTLNSGYTSITRSYTIDPTFVHDYTRSGLTVHLDPSFAEWRIDGGRWNTSGALRLNLPPGPHVIEYSSLADYISPPSETVTLAASSAHTLYTRYISIDPAQLTITTNPAGGQWRIYPYQWPASGTWRDSGATATGLNPGPYTIEYAPVTGYDAPWLTNVQLKPNESQSLSASYQPRMFQYQIVLNPSTARFRLDGGAWNPSGATVMGHQPGDYLIEFEPLAGYTTPAPVTANFAAGGNATFTFTYAPQ